MRAERESPRQWCVALRRKNPPSRTEISSLPHQHPNPLDSSPSGSGMLPTFSYTRAGRHSFSNSSVAGLVPHKHWYWHSAYTQSNKTSCWYLWSSLVIFFCNFCRPVHCGSSTLLAICLLELYTFKRGDKLNKQASQAIQVYRVGRTKELGGFPVTNLAH